MKDRVARKRTLDELAAEPGGKTSWQRVVESVPSSEENDPKEHEERRNAQGFRIGPYGRLWPSRAA